MSQTDVDRALEECSPRELADKGICPLCRQKANGVQEQYSFQVYAGIMCTECAIHGYRDHCGLSGHSQGDPQDLDETYYEEEY